MIQSLDTQLIALANATPSREAVLRRLGYNIDFKFSSPTDWIPVFAGNIQDMLQSAVNEAVSWCGQYLPREYGNQYQGITVIAAATVASQQGELLLKEENQDFETLMRLSGRDYRLTTFIRLVRFSADIQYCWDRSELSITDVNLMPMTESDCKRYLASKAWRSLREDATFFSAESPFVKSISGSDTNVMGLPLGVVARLLHDNRGMP